jgi:selenocysteine lyase/cysteine desulfurase
MDEVARHEAELVAYALPRLAEVPGLELLGPRGADERVGVFTFRLAHVPHMLVASVLGHEFGIGVRAGCFCAHPGMLHLLKVPQSEAHQVAAQIEAHDKRSVPGAVRASLGLYNTPADIDALIDGLQAIAAGQYQHVYELRTETGEYLPSGWLPRYGEFFSATRSATRTAPVAYTRAELRASA